MKRWLITLPRLFRAGLPCMPDLGEVHVHLAGEDSTGARRSGRPRGSTASCHLSCAAFGKHHGVKRGKLSAHDDVPFSDDTDLFPDVADSLLNDPILVEGLHTDYVRDSMAPFAQFHGSH